MLLRPEEREPDLPALLGGAPAFPSGPPPWPRADAAVKAALDEAYACGAWGQYRGPNVATLEAELGAFLGIESVLACASGTLAVEAALRALQVGPGHEVVLAAYDYEATFLTVHALGARPVLADVGPGNWNLFPAALEAALSPATKAVVCSHLHGGLVPMREVVEAASGRGIAVVEDAAQAVGATVQGRPAGTWGDVGTFSFGGSKLLSAGRGGALAFRDGRLRQRAKVWLSRGVQQWAPLSELQAAVLRPQLAGLRAATECRAANVARLIAGLRACEVEGLTAFENAAVDGSPAYYKLGFHFDAERFGLGRESFVRAMRAEGVAFDVGFRALHFGRSPSRFRTAGNLAEATRADAGCAVLHHPVLLGTPADADNVAAAAAKVYRNRDRLRDPA